jgi:hypothetical protein
VQQNQVFYKLSANRTHPNANVWLRPWLLVVQDRNKRLYAKIRCVCSKAGGHVIMHLDVTSISAFIQALFITNLMLEHNTRRKHANIHIRLSGDTCTYAARHYNVQWSKTSCSYTFLTSSLNASKWSTSRSGRLNSGDNLQPGSWRRSRASSIHVPHSQPTSSAFILMLS